MTARGYYKNLSVELEDLEIETFELPAAQAVATAYVKAIQADGVLNDEVLVIRFRLQKVNKKWQVNEAGEVHVLEK
jgi:S-ribosylhomocysteine lyase LuxS involved in autoinducer biosynthesis